MARKLSSKKREQMFAIWVEHQSVYHVAKICKVSPTTAKKYKDEDKWVEREEKVRIKANTKTEGKIVDRLTENLNILTRAKRVYGTELVGVRRVECPKCNHQFETTIPKLKAAFRDIESILRMELLLLEGGEPSGGPKRVKWSIEPPSRE